ncbi:MAG: Nif3-like dinuclear metal center hexameric protein [Spirochaetia bacterium]|nr:Nif3-like dinuclear metal center hexameric protein [Spirochaetia bacterium]MCF7940866.1 Nif3-like dinuclear metal center hexameric protein [Spirochaetia bacterium]
MNRTEIVTWLDEFLRIEEYRKIDSSLNGLQISRKGPEIKKIACAVDACMASFERAVHVGADMLLVHHGLFWGTPLAITGPHYDRLSFALSHDLALYAAHLPLDAHPVVGNNAALADALGLVDRVPFGQYHGAAIGFQGILPEPLTLHEIQNLLGFSTGLTVLPFGRADRISSVAIVSGGAASCVEEAIERSVDLFITGEALHQIYHSCQEHHIHFMAGGHYETEVFGPRALGAYIQKELGVETCFIDLPTGL